jgi:ribonuclease HII
VRTFRVGIDENGLGPRLGPLVVTAVTAATDGDGHKRAESRPRGRIAARLGDSKALVSFGDTALGEAWARALVTRARARDGNRDAPASTPDEVARSLSLDSPEELRRPCPREHEAQCWATHGEQFEASDALVDSVRGDLDKLASLGVNIARVRVAIVCTERLNDGIGRGLSRFDLDLHAMERLALDARAAAGEDVVITCGKVGGFDRYAPHFGPLAGWLHTTLVEGRARSEYALPALGRLAFVRDADAGHLLVAMASLVGKWMRDLLMRRIVRYHRDDDSSLPHASGYHDPVTTRFVAASALARKRRALPDACFERRSFARDAAEAAKVAREVSDA